MQDVIDLAALERLDNEATPGPWRMDGYGVVAQCGNVVLGAIGSDKDGLLIAAFRNDCPTLCALVREACALLQRSPAHELIQSVVIGYEAEGEALIYAPPRCIPDCPGCEWRARRDALVASVKLESN